jgi:hypothetical protein
MTGRYIVKEYSCKLITMDGSQPPKTLKGYHITDTATGLTVAHSTNEAGALEYSRQLELMAQRKPVLKVIK